VLRDAAELVLADVNQRALDYSEVNAALASRKAAVVKSDILAGVDGSFDLIIANPPYMRDGGKRTYRDGGGSFGEELSVRIVREALERLTQPGTLIVYTGAAVVGGVDQFRDAVLPLVDRPGLAVLYEEIDPDVFGEELAVTEYAQVERIAAVGLKVEWTGGA
jgi:23S rRNA G2069 N7-methylase RlmK/C1962 C5-methylase RlmI